jgi:hypothetical protein
VPTDEEGIIELANARDIKKFVHSCGALRVWSREEKVLALLPHREGKATRTSRSRP